MRHHSSKRKKKRIIHQAHQTAIAKACHTIAHWLLLVGLALAPLAYGLTPLWATLGFETIIWVAAACWLLGLLLEQEVELVVSPVIAPVLTLASYVAVRYALNPVESLARHEMMLGLSGALVFLMCLNNFHRRQHAWRMVAAWLAVGLIVASYGVLQKIVHLPYVWTTPQFLEYQGKVSGPFFRPSHFAGFLSLPFFMGAAFFFFSRLGYWKKMALAFACALMAVAALLSFSLAAWLGWVAGAMAFGVVVFARRSYRWRWVAIGSATTLVLILGVMLMLETRQMVGEEPPRLLLWKSALSIAAENPWLGAGPGMFRWMHPSHRALQGVVPCVGNEFLNLLADYGVVGCFLALWAMVALFHRVVHILRARARRYSADSLSNRFALLVGGSTALVAAAAQSLFDFNLHAPAIMFSLIAAMGLVLNCGLHPKAENLGDKPKPFELRTARFKGSVRWSLVLGLGVVLVLLGDRLQRSIPAERHLSSARRAQQQLDWAGAAALYEKAWRADPQSYRVALAAAEFQLARATWQAKNGGSEWKLVARWYERAHIRNPYDGDTLIKIGRIFDLQGQREEAANRYGRAIRLDPKNASYHAQLGLHYERWGDTENAVASFRRARDLQGPDPLPAIKLAERGLL